MSSYFNFSHINLPIPSLIPTVHSLTTLRPELNLHITPIKYSQDLDKAQMERLNTILLSKEVHQIVPKNYQPNGLFKIIQFNLIELLNFLTHRLTVQDMLKESPCLIGGAASHVLAEFDFNDIDLAFYLKSHQGQTLTKKNELEIVLEIVREFICYKLKIIPPNEFNAARDIDDAYLYKKKKVEGVFSYVGLGNVDLKFILHNGFRKSVSSSDGFHIALLPKDRKPEVFCADGNHWCKTNEEFLLAERHLKCRILSIKNPQLLDDLAIRTALRKTQCFRVESEVELASAALTELQKKYPLNAPAKCNELLEKYRKHLESHYDSQGIGRIFNLLNLCSFLLSSEVLEKRIVHEYIRIFAKTLEENSLIQLLISDPSQIDSLLAIARGLLLVEWSKPESTLKAYAFPFCENEQTTRCSLAFPAGKRYHYLALEGSPLDIAKKFILSWRSLSEFYTKKDELSKWNHVPNFLGVPLTINELSEKQLTKTTHELLKSLLKPPFSTILANQFKNLNPESFYDALLQENIPGISSRLIHRYKIESQFPRLQKLANLPASAKTFLHSLRSLIALDEPNVELLKKLTHDLRTTADNKAIEIFKKDSEYFEFINYLLFEIIEHALTIGDLNILQAAQELTSLASVQGILGHANACKVACLIFTACKIKQLAKSPLHLIAFEDFLQFTERWEKRSNELIQISGTVRSQISLHALLTAQKSLANPQKNQDEALTGRCLLIALKAPSGKEHDQGILDAFMKLTQQALLSKDSEELRAASEATFKIFEKKLPLSNSHQETILQLAHKLLLTALEKMKEGVKLSSLLAIDLLAALLKNAPEALLQVRMLFLNLIGNCLMHAIDQQFHSLIQAFAALKILDDPLNEKLKALSKNSPLSALLKEYIAFAMLIDFSYALKYASQPELKRIMAQNEFISTQLMLINQNPQKLSTKQLRQKFSLWSSVQNSNLSPYDKEWLPNMLGSIDLLTMMLMSPKKHDKQVEKISRFVLLSLERYKKLPPDAYAKELQQPLGQLIKILEATSTPLAKKIYEAALECTIFSQKKESLKTLLKKISENKDTEESIPLLLEFFTQLTEVLNSKNFKQIEEGFLQFHFILQFIPPNKFWTPEAKSVLLKLFRVSPQDPKEEQIVQQYILEILKMLKQRDHYQFLPDKYRSNCIFELIGQGWHWKHEAIWNEIRKVPYKSLSQMLTKIESIHFKSDGSTEVEDFDIKSFSAEGPLSFFLEALKQASQCYDVRLFNWIKKEIINKNFLNSQFLPRDASATGYLHCFQHLHGICTRSESKESSELHFLLYSLWHQFLQIPSKIKEKQEILALIINITTSQKNYSTHFHACKIVCDSSEFVTLEILFTLSHSILNLAQSKENLRQLHSMIPLRFIIPPFHIKANKDSPGAELILDPKVTDVNGNTFPTILEYLSSELMIHKLKESYNEKLDAAFVDLISKLQKDNRFQHISLDLVIALVDARARNNIPMTYSQKKAHSTSPELFTLIVHEYNRMFSLIFFDEQIFHNLNKTIQRSLNRNELNAFYKLLGESSLSILFNSLSNIREIPEALSFYCILRFVIPSCSNTLPEKLRSLVSAFINQVTEKKRIVNFYIIMLINELLENADKIGLFPMPILLDEKHRKTPELTMIANQRLLLESKCINEMSVCFERDFSKELLQKLNIAANLVNFSKINEVQSLGQLIMMVHNRVLFNLVMSQDVKIYKEFVLWFKNILNQDTHNQHLELLLYAFQDLERLVSIQSIIKESHHQALEFKKIYQLPDNIEIKKIFEYIVEHPKIEKCFFEILSTKFKINTFRKTDSAMIYRFLCIPNISESLPSILSDKTSKIIEDIVILMTDEMTKTRASKLDQIESSKFGRKCLTIKCLSNIIEFVQTHFPKEGATRLIKRILEIRKLNSPNINEEKINIK